jgi:tetraacyldisaccharide 4'-kinase
LLVIGEGEAGNAAAAHGRSAGLEALRAKFAADAGAASQLKGKRVLAFAGIGNPEKFFRSLEAVGAEVSFRRSLPDHHRFSAGEANELISEAANKGLILVTTEKDRARMQGDEALARLRAKSLTLPVKLAFDDAQSFKTILGKAVAR